MAQIPGGLTLLRSQEISDTSIVGTKDISLPQPVADLARTIYYPQWINGGGFLGSSPYLGHLLSFELTARDNLRVTNAGDPAGLYPFVLKIEEYAENLRARVASGAVSFGPTNPTTNLAITPVRRVDRAGVLRLSDYQKSYDRPNWGRFRLSAVNNLEVITYQYNDSTSPTLKFLVFERP